MGLEVIGPHPFARDEQGKPQCRIGTIFPAYNALYTREPGVHAWQRSSFVEHLNAQRQAGGRPALTAEEEEQTAADSVDLIFEHDPDHILVRPDPDRMDLAFDADERLQSVASKRQIKFLSAADGRVREAIKRRGEAWRLSGVPKAREAKERWVFGSRVGILGLPIYFYNRLTGTRWLTYDSFAGLGALDDKALAHHLQEIAEHALRRNRLNRPEVDFFAADLRRFNAQSFAPTNYQQLAPGELRQSFETLRERFRSAVHEGFRKDDCHVKPWCDRILATLFLEGNETQAEQVMSGLSPEFFMHVEWLAGGRFEEGEFLFDSIYDEAATHPDDVDLQRIADSRAKGIIHNLIRDYGDLEFVNVGCVPESLSLDRPQDEGRRGVYLAEFKSRSAPDPIKRFMRLQKWGVWEHLDEGKNLLEAILESDEYTDYWLDRRLGCRQVGMNMSRRVFMRRLSEIYYGKNSIFRGTMIRTTYFERDYVPGIATDKLPVETYSRPGYALRFAELLGRAAASSIVVGRSYESGTRTVFDDGDEVVIEGEDGLPKEVMVCDHSGAFGEYQLPLETFASHYARPVNARANVVPNGREFAERYLAAFYEQFLHVQGDCAKRRRAFETLFKHCKYDAAGSFAYRWELVLRRLVSTDPNSLVAAIRKHIGVLNTASPPKPVLAEA